ncbi:hypothetical protein HK098_002703 [Nowakowskiella sp. JEL0407]|nr:hypothetical protein HK098_002703 [Nowakowskiella sp. JEL0407]
MYEIEEKNKNNDSSNNDSDDVSDSSSSDETHATSTSVFSRFKKKVSHSNDPSKSFSVQYAKIKTKNKTKVLNSLLLVQDLYTPGNSTTIWSLKFTNSGRYLAAGYQSGLVKVWGLYTPKNSSPTHSVDSIPRKSPTYVSHTSHTNISTPIFSNTPVRIYSGHVDAVLDLDWSSSNKFLLSASKDSTVRLWNLERDECLCVFKNSDAVTAVRFWKDDRFFVSSCLDRRIRIWSIPTKSVLHFNELASNCTASSLAFSHDYRFIIVGTYSGIVLFYAFEGLEYNTQVLIRDRKNIKITGVEVLPVQPVPTVSTNQKSGSGSADDKKIIVTSSDSKIRIFNVRDKLVTRKLGGPDLKESGNKASSDEFGKFIVCGSEDRYVYLWRLESSRKKAEEEIISGISHLTNFEKDIKYEKFYVGENHITNVRIAPSGTRSAMEILGVRDKIEGDERNQQADGVGMVIVVSDFNGRIRVYENVVRGKQDESESVPGASKTESPSSTFRTTNFGTEATGNNKPDSQGPQKIILTAPHPGIIELLVFFFAIMMFLMREFPEEKSRIHQPLGIASEALKRVRSKSSQPGSFKPDLLPSSTATSNLPFSATSSTLSNSLNIPPMSGNGMHKGLSSSKSMVNFTESNLSRTKSTTFTQSESHSLSVSKSSPGSTQKPIPTPPPLPTQPLKSSIQQYSKPSIRRLELTETWFPPRYAAQNSAPLARQIDEKIQLEKLEKLKSEKLRIEKEQGVLEKKTITNSSDPVALLSKHRSISLNQPILRVNISANDGNLQSLNTPVTAVSSNNEKLKPKLLEKFARSRSRSVIATILGAHADSNQPIPPPPNKPVSSIENPEEETNSNTSSTKSTPILNPLTFGTGTESEDDDAKVECPKCDGVAFKFLKLAKKRGKSKIQCVECGNVILV